MATLQVTATVTDNAGLQTVFSGMLIDVQNAPVINSVVVTPAAAPAGTLRTITINASDAEGGPLTYTCFVEGQAATPTGQPNVFTFVA